MTRVRFLSPLCAALAVAALAPAWGPAVAEEKPSTQLSPSVVFGRVAPATVVIRATLADGHSQGSGVVIGPERIVTNYHVVRGSREVQVSQGQRQWSAKMLAMDEQHDLALLQVSGLKLPSVALRNAADVKVGERVFVVGAPHGLELTLSDGLISALRFDEEKKKKGQKPAILAPPAKSADRKAGDKGKSAEKSKTASGDTARDADSEEETPPPAEPAAGGRAPMLQTTAPISPGSSGGGLFDEGGRLVGIVTMKVVGGENLNFALPTEWVREILRGGGSPPARPRANGSLTRRPPALRCEFNMKTTWALFSGGMEMLESTPVEGAWRFVRFDGQVPLSIHKTRVVPLVLADMNRERGYIRFTSESNEREHYFFTVDDDDGSFALTAVEPIDYHGQMRLLATSGRCETFVPRTDPEALPRGGESDPLLCKAGFRAACWVAAEKLRLRDKTGDAAELFEQGCRLGEARSCRQAVRCYEIVDEPEKMREMEKLLKKLPAGRSDQGSED